LQESANYGISSAFLEENMELTDRKEQLERHLEQIDSTKSQLQLVLETIESQNEELQFLMGVIPFANDELQEIARYRLQLPIEREIYELETENEVVQCQFCELTEETGLVKTMIAGLKEENEKLVNRMERANEFERELRLAVDRIHDPIYHLEGIGQDELDGKIQEIHNRLKHELSELNSRFQKEMDEIGYNPTEINEELERQEEVTEALNARISEIIADLERIRDNGTAVIAKQRNRHREELQDIIVRAERKKARILLGEVASPLN
jgi:chromosome segregation ATPase